MPERELWFTTNWESSRSYWAQMFAELGWTGERLSFLEVGCFEGQASLWMMENVLTHPRSRLTVIDPFGITRGELTNHERFVHNLEPYLRKIKVLVGRSEGHLRSLATRGARFDFIYVDGDHTSAAVLQDAVLAWPMLRPGGVMCFDDYQWDDVVLDWQKPQIAVDAFVRCYQKEIDWAHRRGMDQFVVRKEP